MRKVPIALICAIVLLAAGAVGLPALMRTLHAGTPFPIAGPGIEGALGKSDGGHSPSPTTASPAPHTTSAGSKPKGSTGTTSAPSTTPTRGGGTTGGSSPPTQRSYTDNVSGHETASTHTEGWFVGTATGDLPGTWKADVLHTDLTTCGNSCYITGGSFELDASSGTTTTGTFASPTQAHQAGYPDSITVINPGANCTNETFDVQAALIDVGSTSHSGTGRVVGVLTHWRHMTTSGCQIYAATVQGQVGLTY